MPLTESNPDAVAHVYAQGLFELADGAGGREALESTLGELEEIIDLARSDAKFSEFLSSPAIGAKDRTASLDRIFSGRLSDLTLRFLKVLNRKGRLGHLPAITTAFDQLVQEKFGRVEVDVYTAEPISQEHAGLIRDRLQSTLKKDVILHPYTDGAMIGGLKLRIGDQLIDGSVASRLRRIKDQLDVSGAANARARVERMIDDTGM